MDATNNTPKTQADLIDNPAYTTRTARTRNYVSRKSTPATRPAEPYKGKYGTGYTVLTPNWDSTQYCTIIYYIRK